MNFKYRIKSSNISHNEFLQKYLDGLRDKDNSGSAAEKYVYAMHAADLHDIRPEHRVLNEYLLDAAQQGLAKAQFLLGQKLLFGQGCQVDSEKGMAWFKKSVDKVTGWSTLAAAYAANRQFKQAERYQKKAIKKAKYLDWGLSELETRLVNYSIRKNVAAIILINRWVNFPGRTA